VAYRADIEIAVKGAQELKRLQNEIRRSADAVNSLNSNLSGIANLLPRSFNNINKVLSEAAANFNKVALGTEDASTAAQNYYQANKNLNNALRERVKLLDDIQRAERGAVLSNIKASRAAREASGFGAFSSSIDTPTQKSIRRNREKTGLATAAAETAAAVQKLTERQEEFTTRTDAAAQASARQTAAFYRQARIAKEVAKINAATPAAQLLLAAAAPGAPAMSGGARRRITGPVERLGGARTGDEAQRALRLAQGLKEQVRPLSQIEFLYAGIAGEAAKLSRIKALPSTEMLNAAARGLQTIDSIEERRVTRAQRIGNKLQQIQNYYGDTGMANAGSGTQGPAVPPGGIPSRSGGGGRSAGGGRSNVGGAISSALIGGGFPLLFGQGPAAAAGGALGGVAGGLLGGGFGFALSIVGTALGDIITKAEAFDKSLAALNAGLSTTGSTSITTANDVSKLASSLNVTTDEATELLNTFKQFKDGDTREALAGLFGPVGGAATFEAIAKAGVDEKNALAAIFSLRKEIGNDAALQLALQLKSVGASTTQASLLKIILDRSIEISVAQASQVNFTDRLLSIWEGIVAGVAQALSLATRFIAKMQEGSLIKLPFLDKIIAALGGVEGRTPKEIADQRGQDVAAQLKAERDRIRKALAQETEVAGTESALSEQFKQGAKPPEDRTAQLREEFTALVAIGQAEDRIRDLLFDGRELRAAEVELQKQIADIERDRNKALISANYESERVVITKIAEARIVDAQLKQQDKIREINQKRFEEELQVQEAVRSSVQSFTDMRKEQELQLQYSKTYSRLLMEGMLPAEAERIANFEKIVAAQLKAVDLQVLITSAAITEAKARGASTFQLEKDLDLLERKRKAIEGEAAAGPGAGPTDRERLQTEADRVRGELNTLTDPINAITTAAAGIGDAFSTSFKGIISGSMTAKEALASFFTSVADMFLDMAAQIIAKMIQMAILNAIVSLLPGSSGGGLGSSQFKPGAPAQMVPSLPNVPDYSGAFKPRANGGPVSSGQTYMVGERGPELFVPGRSGTIVANDKMGGGSTNVVVNVDAKGSSVEGNEQGANQLGRVISAAVQSELIKQQRPGGILAR
jgi:hypothetical protein